MNILDEAERKGIKRIIYLSIYETDISLIKKLKIDVGFIKIAVEERLLQSDFNWTVLACPPSFEIFTTFTRKRMLIVPGGGAPLIPSVAPQDVGEIAAQASIRDDLKKLRLHLTYSEAFAFPNVAERFSNILKRKIRYQKIPLVGLKIVSIISYPLNPYLRHLVKYVGLLNNFPQEIAKQVPANHKILFEKFDYEPMSLEEYAKYKFEIKEKER